VSNESKSGSISITLHTVLASNPVLALDSEVRKESFTQHILHWADYLVYSQE